MALSLELIEKLPKTDLHCHLDGSMRITTILDLAQKQGIRLPADTPEGLLPYVTAGNGNRSLDEYLKAFDITLRVLQSKETLFRAAYELAEDAARENVRYMEVRYAPMLHTQRGLKLTAVVEAVLEGLRFLAHIPNDGLRVVECRLGGFEGGHGRRGLLGRPLGDDDDRSAFLPRHVLQKKPKKSDSPDAPVRYEVPAAYEGLRTGDAVAMLNGGSGRDLTVAANRAGWDAWHVCPRLLADVRLGHTRVRLGGSEWSRPFALAPVAHHRLAHAEGERATAMGAAAADVCMMASTLSNCPLEAIAEAGGGHALRWFQLYLQPSRDESLALVKRAAQAGYQAIVLTLDASIQLPSIRALMKVRRTKGESSIPTSFMEWLRWWIGRSGWR